MPGSWINPCPHSPMGTLHRYKSRFLPQSPVPSSALICCVTGSHTRWIFLIIICLYMASTSTKLLEHNSRTDSWSLCRAYFIPVFSTISVPWMKVQFLDQELVTVLRTSHPCPFFQDVVMASYCIQNLMPSHVLPCHQPIVGHDFLSILNFPLALCILSL